MELAPQAATAWINLGAVCRLLGDPGLALAHYRKAEALGYAGMELGDAIAGALLDLGQTEEAIAQARATVRRFPQAAQAHLTLAHLRWEHDPDAQGPRDPLLELDSHARQQPHNLPLQQGYIGLLLRAGRAELALERLQALAEAEGALPLALQALQADAYDQLGEAVRAGALYARLQAAGGDREPAFLDAHARHLLRTGRPEAALDCLQQALALAPDDQEAWAWLGTAWRLLGDPRADWLCDVERLVGEIAIEPPPGYPDLPAFLAALVAALRPLHRARR